MKGKALVNILIAGIIFTCVAVVPANQVQANGRSEVVKAQNSNQPKRIDLAHPVSVKDALTALKQIGSPEQEIGLKGDQVLGGFKPNPIKTLDSQVKWAEGVFQRRYQITPVVSSITFMPNTLDAKILSLKNQLAASPSVSIGRAVAPTDHPTMPVSKLNRSLDGQHFPNYYPTTFWGQTYDSPDGKKGYSYWIDYLDIWGFNSDPTALPDDWGLELGFTSYNSSILGVLRPLCGFGGTTNFWSRVYSEGFVWTTYNVPEAVAPYADYNINSDNCRDNSVEVGIGYPKLLPMNRDMNFTLELEAGEQPSSPASATVSMISNDCNDMDVWPGTNCMGLNTLRKPEGYERVQSYVNRNRGWTIPSCMAMQDGMDEPSLGCSNQP